MTKEDLAAYILKFMLAVVPTKEHSGEDPQEVQTRYEQRANVIATVAMDPNEPPLFAGPKGRIMTALTISAIDRYESTYVKGPVHGDCIDRKTGRSTPDNGRCRKGHPDDIPRAFCPMQIIPGPFGMLMTHDAEGKGSTYIRVMLSDTAETKNAAITGETLDSGDEICFRLGLHMVRESIKNTGDLGVYTGEGKGGIKAKHRLDLAKWWFLKHPYEGEI